MFIILFVGWGETEPLGIAPMNEPTVSAPDDKRIWSSNGMMITENHSASGETCGSAIVSTTNSLLAALGFDSGLHSETPVTNHTQHETIRLQFRPQHKAICNINCQ